MTTMMDDDGHRVHHYYRIIAVNDSQDDGVRTRTRHGYSSRPTLAVFFVAVFALVAQSIAEAAKLSSINESFTGRARHAKYLRYRIFYQPQKTEKTLPICSKWAVCNKVDTYEEPWLEKQCRCPGQKQCSMSMEPSDGHTITDKSRHFKVCEPTDSLRKCRYFRDVTWTTMIYPDNTRQQTVHCICPKNSVAYILKTHSYPSPDGTISQFSYACSPHTKLKCKWKEPCRLFTVKKRSTVDSVNYDTLCKCSSGYQCPKRHTDHGVIFDMIYNKGEKTRMYSGYCIKSIKK